MTTATYPETLRTIADAVAAVEPHWTAGSPAPADLETELADVMLTTPMECIERADEQFPGLNLAALRQWAKMHRDHARFFELLAELKAMGREAATAPANSHLLIELYRTAPPLYREGADAILADALPKPTHVNDAGEPVFSAQEIADHFGKTPDEVVEEVARLLDGLSDGDSLHTGNAHPLQ